MYGIFKKKTPLEKLQQRYEKLLKEAHKLSQVNRSKGDSKYAEAEALLNEIKQLEEQN
ncbi:Lacal_2735 family protein [Robiginitalea sp. IMCC43444]|uniref:Lacal_2735 family protein n=1 Tax=Robiginitalea sp. IMCC43444 TaxID=3459121 RepID=UPI0040429FDD